MADQSPGTESQSQRWLKYGSNTVIVSVAVIALAVLAVYAAQRKDKRWDTTAAALYTLKPQSLKVVADNKQHISITSFYSKAKRTDAAYGTNAAAADADASAALDRQADVVSDLLDEYASHGNNITAQTIDPKLNPSKASDLIDEVTNKYGGEVAKYKAFTDALPAKFDAIGQLAKAEKAKVAPLRKQLPDTPNMRQVAEMLGSVGTIGTDLSRAQEGYEKLLHQKPPDYKGVSLSVSAAMDELSTDQLNPMIEGFKANKDAPGVPAPLRDYMVAAIPAYEQLKKQVDALSKEAKGLGELKLDTIREALRQDNAILVRGDKDWKVIRYDQVWKMDGRDARPTAGAAPKPRFAGEQMITTAIMALNRPAQTKVCFVRAGGGPLAAPGGLFSSIGDRLRDYNFDVSDKDVTGQYAMQQMQQQQQMPPAPEPTDADMDDAIWVVYALEPQQNQNPMMGGMGQSQVLSDKVAEHVASGHHYVDGKKVPGGSAYVFALPQGATLEKALTSFGIRIRTDAVSVHQLVQSDDAASDPDDIINQAARVPYIFPIKDWGDSPITAPMRTLPGIAIFAVPVQTTPTAGVTARPLLPIPTAPDSPPSWGETDLEALQVPDAAPKLDPADIAGPLFAGAAAERADGARLVVVGSPDTFRGSDMTIRGSVVDYADPELRKRGIYSPLFPGSAEFFMNGMFWLARDEPMIAISPAAMTVPRIAPMSKAGQNVWHVGVLLLGLPGLVLAAGVAAYLSRRD